MALVPHDPAVNPGDRVTVTLTGTVDCWHPNDKHMVVIRLDNSYTTVAAPEDLTPEAKRSPSPG